MVSQRLLGALSMALVGPGCAGTLSVGPDISSVAGRTVAGGRMTLGGGLGNASGSQTFDLRAPVGLKLGKTMGDDGDDDDGNRTEAALEFGTECSWGSGHYGSHAGALVGVGLEGTSGAYLGLRGGPTLFITEPEEDEWTPTLMLSGTAAAGLGGDLAQHGVFGLTLSFGYDVHGPGLRIPSGRPLRDMNGHEWVPRVRTLQAAAHLGERDSGANAASAAGLPRAVRRLLGEQWLCDARAEYASVASFLRLALELAELKAPASLLSRACLAAHQEVAHARACFALAASYLGFLSTPEPLPVPRPRPALSFAGLAVECWLDGCVGEGFAARLAAARARRAVGSVRTVLERIARDEAAHAELAWDILRFCQRHDARGVTAALAAAESPTPDAPALNEADEVVADLAAHGVLPFRLQREQHLASTRSALRRAARAGLWVGLGASLHSMPAVARAHPTRARSHRTARAEPPRLHRA